MNDTSNNDPWMQFYQQQPLTDCMALDSTIEEEGFSEANMSSDKVILSQRNSYTNSSSGHLNPKGNNNTNNNSAFKPIQKRSRSSKRTLTTLVNANTTNFRELVQQLTGCPTPTTSMMSSFSNNKEPITLNFQQGNKQQVHVQHNNTTISRKMAQLPQQQFLQEEQSGYYSLEHVTQSNDFLQTVSNSWSSMEFSDGLLVKNNDFSLHEFAVNAFSDYPNEQGSRVPLFHVLMSPTNQML